MTPDGLMQRAVELAMRGKGHTRPNPAVGAVLARDGAIVGEGWHRRAGEAHAEAAAIADAGAAAAGADLYVTLEPCSKPGRVGACTDAIAAAGVGRVFYAVEDPNPKNAGGAKGALAAHGIPCEMFAGSPETVHSAKRLVRDFSKFVLKGLPYVTVKLAMSLDGRICDRWGDAKWISSEKARARTGLLREEVDAIMVGAETVRRDNPSLLSHGRPNPDLVRVVVSRSGNLPQDAQIFTDGKNETLVFDDAEKALRELAGRGIMHVLCEGGASLAYSLAKAGFVDEWIAVLSPKVIGDGRISQAVEIGSVQCLQDW